MITMQGTPTVLTDLRCPHCGNREDFFLQWLGDLSQTFLQDPATGARDYDAHDNEGDTINVDTRIVCRLCDTLVADRSVTVIVGPWSPAHGTEALPS